MMAKMMMMPIVKMLKLLISAKGEGLTMLDRLVNLKDLSQEERNSLVAMKDKLEKMTVLRRFTQIREDKSKAISMII